MQVLIQPTHVGKRCDHTCKEGQERPCSPAPKTYTAQLKLRAQLRGNMPRPCASEKTRDCFPSARLEKAFESQPYN